MTMICDSLIGTIDDIESQTDDDYYTKYTNGLICTMNYLYLFDLITNDD